MRYAVACGLVVYVEDFAPRKLDRRDELTAYYAP